MAIPEPVVFPLAMACPQCRFYVWFTEADVIPGDVATCPRCKTILEKPDFVTCNWPVTADRPSGNSADGGQCPEPNCFLFAGHSENHAGKFNAEDLVKVDSVN